MHAELSFCPQIHDVSVYISPTSDTTHSNRLTKQQKVHLAHPRRLSGEKGAGTGGAPARVHGICLKGNVTFYPGKDRNHSKKGTPLTPAFDNSVVFWVEKREKINMLMIALFSFSFLSFLASIQ